MKHTISFELEFRTNPYPGKLIVVEGIDGSGKTTQAKEVVKMLNKKGHDAAYTKEPTDQLIGQFIREKILSGKYAINPLALQYLFNADRVMHMEKMEEFLKKGKTIVMDRYFWSSVAYALADLPNVKDWYLVSFSVLSFYHQFIAPDKTFFLDISLTTALERIKQSGKHAEIYDNGQALPKIAENYTKLIQAFPEMFTMINGNRKQAEITEEIVEKIITSL